MEKPEDLGGPGPEELRAETPDETPSETPSETFYHLRISARGNEVWVQRRGVNEGRTFASLLLAFGHIERELAQGRALTHSPGQSQPEGLR